MHKLKKFGIFKGILWENLAKNTGTEKNTRKDARYKTLKPLGLSFLITRSVLN